MKHTLVIQSLPVGDLIEKHEKFISNLRGLDAPAGIVVDGIPELRGGKNESYLGCSLSKYFGKGIISDVCYSKKRNGGISPIDSFQMDFTASRIDYEAVLKNCSKYVEFFEASSLYCARIEFMSYLPLPADSMRTYRICPTEFMSEERCMRSFGVSAEEFQRKVSQSPLIESVQLVCGGVLLIASFKPLTIEGELAVNGIVREALLRD